MLSKDFEKELLSRDDYSRAFEHATTLLKQLELREKNTPTITGKNMMNEYKVHLDDLAKSYKEFNNRMKKMMI